MKKLAIVIFVIASLYSCTNPKQNKGKNTITVSILPQKYFVEKIAGARFDINVMIPPGASPVTYEPTPGQMKSLSNSHVYFRIGHIEFEKTWMVKLQQINPEMAIIDLSETAKLIKPEDEQKEKHHDDHHHHGVDPHIWLSPKEVKKQITHIHDYLSASFPEYKHELNSNYNNLTKEVDSLDSFINKQLKPFQGKKFLIFHPALSYLARDYNLEQISIEIDGKEPTPANIRDIIEVAKKENIHVIFVQKQFNTHNARVIANEINGRVVQIDPLAENWKENIIFITNEIVKSYSGK